MQERESYGGALQRPFGMSGWGPWSLELAEPADAAPATPMAWIGGGLSLAMWACATLLALNYL